MLSAVLGRMPDTISLSTAAGERFYRGDCAWGSVASGEICHDRWCAGDARLGQPRPNGSDDTVNPPPF